jgi:hypothetical protein
MYHAVRAASDAVFFELISLSRESPLKCIFVFIFSAVLWSGQALARPGTGT